MNSLENEFLASVKKLLEEQKELKAEVAELRDKRQAQEQQISALLQEWNAAAAYFDQLKEQLRQTSPSEPAKLEALAQKVAQLELEMQEQASEEAEENAELKRLESLVRQWEQCSVQTQKSTKQLNDLLSTLNGSSKSLSQLLNALNNGFAGIVQPSKK